mgnify:FL=1
MFDEKRTEVLQIRLSKGEKKLLGDIAIKHNTTMGSILRELFKQFAKKDEE